jgi:hypothetical protein
VTDWDALYAYVIAATGWTWEYIDVNLTLPRLEALQKHWLDCPPIHVTAARHFPLKSAASSSAGKPRKITNAWEGAEIIDEARFAELRAGQTGRATVQHIQLPR